jgi:hypothetical protein
MAFTATTGSLVDGIDQRAVFGPSPTTCGGSSGRQRPAIANDQQAKSQPAKKHRP